MHLGLMLYLEAKAANNYSVAVAVCPTGSIRVYKCKMKECKMLPLSSNIHCKRHASTSCETFKNTNQARDAGAAAQWLES